MSDDMDDLRSRRAEIEQTAVRSSRRSGVVPVLLASVCTAGLGLGGYVLYDNLFDDVDVTAGIETSDAAEFPDDRDVGTSLELPEPPTPIVIDRPVIQEVTDSATLARLSDLEAQLEAANARIEASANETESERVLREELQRERDRFAQEIRSLNSSAQNDQDRAREAQASLQQQITELNRRLDQERNAWQSEKTQIEMDKTQDLNSLESQYATQISNLERDIRTAKSAADQRVLTLEEEIARLIREADAVDPNEQERLAEEAERRRRFEEARAEAEALEASRISSGMVALNNTGAVEAGAQESRELSANEAFVRGALNDVPVASASQIANPHATVLQGTIIQASLETAIDSSLPGQIRATVNEHVYSMDGSAILIPAGSKVFGEYSDDLGLGQRRILIAWTRIITPSNRSVSIASYGGDQLGRSGTGGDVDTRFGARFGSAALISIIGATPAVIANQAADNPLTQEAIEDIGGDFSSATSSALGEVLSIKPVIRVTQGSAVTIILDRDVEIF